MEYRYYTPLEADRDLKKNKFFIAGVLIVLFFFGISTISLMLVFEAELATDVSTVSYKSITNQELYYFDDLTVLRQYKNVNESYMQFPFMTYYDGTNYIVRFTDKDGKRVYASMSMDDYDELKESYDNQKLSSYSGCFLVSEIINSDEEASLKKAYEGYNSSVPGEIANFNLRFESKKSSMGYFLVRLFTKISISFIFLPMDIIWVIILVDLINERKYIKQYLEAFYENANPPTDQ